MTIKELKIFVVKFLLFVVMLVVIDRGIGYVNDYLKNTALEHSPRGMVTEYTMEKVDADIVLIGASEVMHSFNCTTITDTMNMSAYNVGKDGKGFYYQCAVVDGILNRYSPQIIVWSTSPSYLSLPNTNDNNGVSDLNPYYYSHPFCYNAINMTSKYARVKMLSKTYACNTRLLVHLYKSFLPDYPFVDGYNPLYGQKELDKDRIADYQDYLDTVRANTFEQIIKRGRKQGVEFVFVLVPRYETGSYEDLSQYKALYDIIKRNDCYLIEEFYHSDTIMYPELFYDNAHLNFEGAERFSKMFASRLKEIYNNRKSNNNVQ